MRRRLTTGIHLTGHTRAERAEFLRTFFYGVEDGVVTTGSLSVGLVFSGASRETVLVSGLIVLAVQAFVNGLTSWLSVAQAEEYLKEGHNHDAMPVLDALIVFVSFLVAGFVPLAPFMVLDKTPAAIISGVLSLVLLVALGLIGARIARGNVARDVLRTVVTGVLAVLVGILVGQLARAI